MQEWRAAARMGAMTILPYAEVRPSATRARPRQPAYGWRRPRPTGGMAESCVPQPGPMAELRDPHAENELQDVAGLAHLMPATRNRLHSDEDVVGRPLERKVRGVAV